MFTTVLTERLKIQVITMKFFFFALQNLIFTTDTYIIQIQLLIIGLLLSISTFDNSDRIYLSILTAHLSASNVGIWTQIWIPFERNKKYSFEHIFTFYGTYDVQVVSISLSALVLLWFKTIVMSAPVFKRSTWVHSRFLMGFVFHSQS